MTQATRVTATTTVFQRAMATEVAIGRTKLLQGQGSGAPSASSSPPSSLQQPQPQQPQQPLTVPPSPQSSTFGGSEEEDASASSSRMSGSTSTSASSSLSPSTDTQTEEEDTDLVYYLDSPLSPKMAFERNEAPTQHGIQTFHKQYHLLKSTSDTFGGSSRDDGEYEGAEYVEDEEATSEGEGGTLSPRSAGSLTSEPAPSRTSASVVHPTILVNSRTHVIPDGPFSAPIPSSASSSFSSTSPISPGLRYHGWLSGVVKPLEEYIDEPVDPREYYLDLAEVAEGDNGPVYSARISEHANLARLTKLPP
ncbi:hypothetical protein D9757_001667 [Collybiopsis confluens]|uniref:Uncharacterized protein n=1 Tax=Collybiopsis confluens TaxID=2823264 RepID=A0A8H5HYC4_9AGAR|nr:hypothetical protein D9757_001667 [Collybiopsis confluens]